MKRDKLFKIIARIIDDKIGLYVNSESDNIFKDLGFDSLDSIEFLMECEHEFNLSINDSDVESICTIKEILDYLELHVK